jgi:hypothetical protein
MRDNEKGGTCSTHRQGKSLANMMSGLCRGDAHEICDFLGHFVASSGNPIPTFRDNLSVPSSKVGKSKEKAFLLGFGLRYKQHCLTTDSWIRFALQKLRSTLILSFHLLLWLPSGLLTSGFRTKLLMNFSSVLIFPDLITVITSSEQYKSWSVSLCSLPRPPSADHIYFPITLLSYLLILFSAVCLNDVLQWNRHAIYPDKRATRWPSVSHHKHKDEAYISHCF